MPDREKVIKAYKCCKNSFDRICEKCPYDKDCYHDGFHARFIKEAIEMLKLQQLDILSMRDTMQSMIEGVCVFAGNKQILTNPQIVRCKDCKHRDPEDFKCDCGHDIHWELPRPDNWFCADGKHK